MKLDVRGKADTSSLPESGDGKSHFLLKNKTKYIPRDDDWMCEWGWHAKKQGVIVKTRLRELREKP